MARSREPITMSAPQMQGFDGGATAFEAGRAAAPSMALSPQFSPAAIPGTAQPVGATASSGPVIPSSPTPIAGGSFTATGASLGAMGGPAGAGIGAGVGLLLDGGLMWWQKHEADKAAAKQLREARRINALQEAQERRDRLEARRRFELEFGIAQEDREFQRKEYLKNERLSKIQRIKQAMLDSLAAKGQMQDQFVQRGYI